MGEQMRLDRFLSECGEAATRSEAKKLLKTGAVLVNQQPVRSGDVKIDTSSDAVMVDGKLVSYQKFRYILLNKPAGYVTATQDRTSKTVMDCVPFLSADSYFPVGRLDKDTEGLLVITNDGALAHELLSPRKHVPKTYEVLAEGKIAAEETKPFAEGMQLHDFTAKPAVYTFLSYEDRDDGQATRCLLTITEGKFHQVKRMFAGIGHPVQSLKRIAMGGLQLPADLAAGAYLELSEEELRKQLEMTETTEVKC